MNHRHEIRTPEWSTIDWPIAGIGSRALAALLDALVILIVDSLLFLIIGLTSLKTPAQALASGIGHGGGVTAALFAIGGLLLVAFFFTVFYFVLCESLWSGRSVGKWAMGIRVVSTQGRRVTFFSSLVRNLVRVVDYLPTGYLVGLVIMLVTKKEQRLGDLAAGTVVIAERESRRRQATTRRQRRRSRSSPWLDLSAESAPGASPEASRALTRCSAQQRDLLIEFVQRAPYLPADKADALAQQLAQGIRATLQKTNPDLVAWCAPLSNEGLIRHLYQATAPDRPPLTGPYSREPD